MSVENKGIYKLDNLPFTSKDFHKKFTRLAGPLSLFDAEDNPEVGNENPDVERPLTPVEEAIKGPPSSFSALAKLIRPRLTPRDISGLSVSDQQELIGVIMNEINNVWEGMKKMPPDPFLSTLQNIELKRRLAIEIVTIAQGLFAKFLAKAQTLNSRGVFSGPANMSRLKTQLAMEANKSFNVLSIRRNLAMDMKNPLDSSTVSSTRMSLFKLTGTPPLKTYKALVIRQEEERMKLHLTKEERLQRLMQSEISDMQRKMPCVAATHDYGMRAAREALNKRTRTPSVAETVQSGNGTDLELTGILDDYLNQKKCVSAPYLPVGESLLDDLGLSREDLEKVKIPRSSSVDKIQESHRYCGLKRDIVHEPEPGSSDYAAIDLQKLVMLRSTKPVLDDKQDEKENGDLPPLLQALAHYSTKKPKTKPEVNKADIEADELCSETDSLIGSTKASSIAMDPGVIDGNITEFSGEEHPQPAVVSLRLPDKSVVRTSDVRVSNRVNKSSVALKRYPTVYNDLTGEIDPHTVKWLDRNLFIGEEIREVYKEIIKTMNTDHILFDKDSYVESSASDIDLSLSTASFSLQKPKGERIMNESLHRNILPPWGFDVADDWRNSPKFGGLGREDILQSKIARDTEGAPNTKSYNSWLAWWRSTITYDDYLKFISAQENDFLSMLFHLYDSEDDSEDEGKIEKNRPDTVQMKLNREREKKMAQLKDLKNQFQSGFWNVNSVLLGGLGQDPIMEEDELLSGRSTRCDQRSISQASQGSGTPDRHSSRTKDGASSQDTRSIANTIQTKSGASKTRPLSLQDRLERLWTLLCMPDAQRLDMAIKYSSEPQRDELEQALDAWEAAAEVILERESLLTKLEDFERIASNPNRFFERGGGGASLRIRESKLRNSFDKQLSDLDREVRRTVTMVKKRFSDGVTFQGRPYLDKLRHDRTEMLYWLQQERRQVALDREVLRTREVSLNSLELPPLSTDILL